MSECDQPRRYTAAQVAVLLSFCAAARAIEITPTDSQANDYFGGSIAIESSRILVASRRPNGISSRQTGAAYLFDQTTGAQLHELAPPGGYAGNFGQAVALSGNIAAVGAPSSSAGPREAGAVHLFDATSGKHLRQLTPDLPSGYAKFGSSIATSESHLVVGAPEEAYEPASFPREYGAVYVFDPSTQSQQHRLTPSDPHHGQLFGASVAISGDLIAVGSPGHAHHGTKAGAVYLFDAISGNQIARLFPEDPRFDKSFGGSVFIDASTLLVGAPLDDQVRGDAGAAYLFDVDSLAQTAKLVSPSPVFRNAFSALGMDGDHVLVGQSGAAWLSDPTGRGPEPIDLGASRTLDIDIGDGMLAVGLLDPDRSGQVVLLSLVPEPSSVAMLLGVLALETGWRRRAAR